MECIEARALKSSFLSQMANTQAFQNDDVWCVAKIGSAAADDFPVEDLLNLNPDLPEKESQQGLSFSQEDHQLPQQELSNNSSFTFTGAGDFDSLSQPALPVDDLENLEWLSQFVDDSTSGLSLLCPAQSFESGSNSGEPQKLRSPRFPLPVHVKARSTRSREPRGRPWTLASPPSSAVRSFLTPSFSHTSSPFLLAIPVQGTEWLPISEKPPARRRKRRAELDSVFGRRCTHCQVQKTPQWRTGPMGPKTLCNACGVRYKSGRLFPEYRPAFSPTFSHGQHSNSHRKVVELRRKKESEEMVVGPGFEQVLIGDSLSRFM